MAEASAAGDKAQQLIKPETNQTLNLYLQLLYQVWERPAVQFKLSYAAFGSLHKGLAPAGAQAVVVGVDSGNASFVAEQTVIMVQLGYTKLVSQIVATLVDMGRPDASAKVSLVAMQLGHFDPIFTITKAMLNEGKFDQTLKVSEHAVVMGVDDGMADEVAKMTCMMVDAGFTHLIGECVASLVDQGKEYAPAQVSIATLNAGNVGCMTAISAELTASGHFMQSTKITGELINAGYAGFVAGLALGGAKAGDASKEDKPVGEAISETASGFAAGVMNALGINSGSKGKLAEANAGGGLTAEDVATNLKRQQAQVRRDKEAGPSLAAHEAGDIGDGKHGVPGTGEQLAQSAGQALASLKEKTAEISASVMSALGLEAGHAKPAGKGHGSGEGKAAGEGDPADEPTSAPSMAGLDGPGDGREKGAGGPAELPGREQSAPPGLDDGEVRRNVPAVSAPSGDLVRSSISSERPTRHGI